MRHRPRRFARRVLTALSPFISLGGRESTLCRCWSLDSMSYFGRGFCGSRGGVLAVWVRMTNIFGLGMGELEALRSRRSVGRYIYLDLELVFKC